MKVNLKNHWFTEWFTADEKHSHRLRRILVHKRTKFQKAILAETASFGKCLILDGEMQSAESDEFIYHEALVHPPLLLHPHPKTVLILGGGEGATVREIFKHKSIQSVVMVDIDGEVVDFCKRHLRQWHRGLFDHPKLDLVIQDAKRYVEETPRRFDVILSDLPTPIEGGPAFQLYTREFYKTLIRKLSPQGVFGLQAGSGNLLQIQFHSALVRTLRSLFKIVRPYYAYVPSFDVPWAFAAAARGKDPMTFTQRWVNRALRARVRGPLRFYDGMTHEGLFRIPKNIRELLARERQMFTAHKPVFFFK